MLPHKPKVNMAEGPPHLPKTLKYTCAGRHRIIHVYMARKISLLNVVNVVYCEVASPYYRKLPYLYLKRYFCNLTLRKRCSLHNYSSMAHQKSILSFFKSGLSKHHNSSPNQDTFADGKESVKREREDDSPVKGNSKRSKVRKLIDSDDDDSDDNSKEISKVKEKREKNESIDDTNQNLVTKIKEEEKTESSDDKEAVSNNSDSKNVEEGDVINRKDSKPVYGIFAKSQSKSKQEKSSKQAKTEIPSSRDTKSGILSDEGKSKDETNSFNPAKSSYHPIDDACWKRGEKVPYLALARTFEEIEKVSSRLKMTEVLANFLRSVIVLSPDDLLFSIYLSLNKVGPDYEGLELGIGDMILMKSLAQATGRTVEKIKAEVNLKGDLGLVAESSRGTQKTMFAPPKLTLSGVFSKLKEISKMSGNAAQSKKTDIIKGMLVACRYSEARYLIRSLSGKLRIGLAEQSLLAALAQAGVLTPPNQPYPPEVVDSSKSEGYKKRLENGILTLKTTYCECPNYDKIVQALFEGGIESLSEKCKLTLGVPLKPMLAHPTKGIAEVLQRFDNAKFTCEFKYDGERAQIHVLEDGKVYIYSRNQENNTSKYPDIIARIPQCLKPSTKSCILDTEAVAWDRENKQILPFQILSTRKRKDATESEIKVQVCVFVFDLLYLNGTSLVKESLRERRRLLRDAIQEVEGQFMFVKSFDGEVLEDIQEFLEESIKANCEGLMVKTLDVDASYEIAKRSRNWLKVKKDYLEGVGDTLDAVVIGGYFGKGKRTGSYGGFLLACYDDENEEFQTLCKIGTGFTEEQLETHTAFLKQHVIDAPKSYYRYDSSLEADVWFEPVQVWEIKCADLSVSPVHKAGTGLVDPVKGISLRFPRFIRIREDKNPENATTASQVADLYNNQEQIKNKKVQAKDDDFMED